MSLSHDDVVRIIQLLDASHFDELRLESEGVKLHLRRNGAGDSSVVTSAPTPVAPVASKPASGADTPVNKPPIQTQSTAVSSNHLDIKAPMLGTFYGAPKPGAASFVSAGSQVTKDTAIGIIEVMKLMNSVSAGVEGEIAEVLVRDGDLVEFDQVLMRVKAQS
jgi:acetyl-CoA carboxylase biotin carboxyl carrier protein